MILRFVLCATVLCFGAAQPALAAPGDPVKIGDGLTLDPIVDARLRYEHVGQPTTDADALTIRLRAGVELKHKSGFSALVEGSGTLAIVDNYNAFPFVIADSQRRPAYSVVADPMNVGLTRLQLQYKSKKFALTVGRQLINLDDQRWVGGVAWRQNIQTFDAVRAEATVGPVALDGTYSISQRTIFGVEAGSRSAFDGDFVFLGAGTKVGPVTVKAFAYLLDFEVKEQAGALATTNADTQTYGARAVGAFPLSKQTKLNLVASYARQSNYANNPAKYGVDYLAGEAGISHGQWALTAGYEKLGSDGVRAVQTPIATLHKFNGWADVFLTTPAAGIEEWYLGATMKFPKVKAVPGLNAAVSYHSFSSDVGSVHYGNEWDASLGFKIKRVNVLAKYANYTADRFAVNTSKFWLQFEIAY